MLGRSAQILRGLVAPRLWRIFGWFDSSILKRRGSGGLVRSWGLKQAVADSEKPAARGSAEAAPPAGAGGWGAECAGRGVLVLCSSTWSRLDSEHVSACQVSAESKARGGLNGLG